MLVKSFFITLTQRYWHLVDSQNRNGGLCWRREQKPFLSAIIEGNTLRSLRLRSVFVTEICLIRPRRPDIATPLSNPPPPSWANRLRPKASGSLHSFDVLWVHFVGLPWLPSSRFTVQAVLTFFVILFLPKSSAASGFESPIILFYRR